MAQHLNLYDPAQRPKAQPLNASQGLLAAGLILGLTAGGAASLQALAANERDAAKTLAAQLAQARAQTLPLAANVAAAAELAQLRALDLQQRRVRSALDGGGATSGEGYAGFFNALARQAHPALWITGFSVSPDGVALDLSGRMMDAAVLPDYLRRLNQEPLFRGRPFAQLDLKAVEPKAEGAGPAQAGFTEFALRTQVARAETTR
ncbi:MAG: PilN domain-containing protein [Aquabacterium sp.]